MHGVDLEALDKVLGNVNGVENFSRRQRLELELRAINFWDAQYHADPNRDNDICSFNARQVRRKEILREIGGTR